MDDPKFAHLPELKVSDLHFRPQRNTKLPIALFIATCLSTFWVGATGWQPLEEAFLGSYAAMWVTVRTNWFTGLQYMVAVLAILLTHEMGHFLQTVKHRIPASYPLCIPIPFNAIGTMGAVIGMDGMRANRRQIFDIGIAGPLAGLVVAIPVLWWGIRGLDDSSPMGRPPLDRSLAAESLFHGRLGRHADYWAQHVADQSARRRPYDLCVVSQSRLHDCAMVSVAHHSLRSD